MLTRKYCMLLTMQEGEPDLPSKPECQRLRIESESTGSCQKVKFIRLEGCLKRKLLNPTATFEKSQRMGVITSTRASQKRTRVAVGELM